MKKIILVGAGKGGLIHYNSYKKLGYIENILIIDNQGKTSYLYSDLTSGILEKQIIIHTNEG